MTLRDLIDRFSLERVDEPEWFPEWQEGLPEVDPTEQQQLERIRIGFLNLLDYPPLLEDVVRMAVVDPLLFLGGFYLPPFHVRSEVPVELVTEDEGLAIAGNLQVIWDSHSLRFSHGVCDLETSWL